MKNNSTNQHNPLWMRDKARILTFGLLGACFLLSVVAQGAITLPIEVFGAPPHDETVEVELTAAQVADTDALWLQLHNVAYDGKGWVEINGVWFKLWNDIAGVEVAPKDLAYGGFGGGFQTIQCSIAATNFPLVAGTNSIKFRFLFKHDDFETAGFRVVRFNLRDDAGVDVLPPETFVWDDPTTWEPPLNTETNIAAGEAIWRYGDLGMNAHCADCHTQDGFDLKYFNVSNKVIIEQCKKSGFSELEGQQVASYIRSLNYAVVPEARPWNPPYQPGPEIESREDAPYKWAAGAGLDAVLDTDQDMIVELFGSDNPSEEEVLTALNHYETQPNLRTGRISVQFPDWISWIPRTHPKDILASNDVAFLDQAYATLRETIINAGGGEGLNTANNSSVYNSNDIFRVLGEFAREAHEILDPATGNNPRSPTWANSTDLNEAERKSLAAWHSVKMFEVINEFGLHDITNYVNVAEQYPFQWPTRQWAVFQNAAHVIADKRGNSYFSTDVEERTQKKSIYLSSIWYQLQMVLTPGNRTCGTVVPNDYAYNMLHIQKIGHRSGIFEPARFFQNYWQCAYQRNNGLAPATSGTVKGWNMRELSPWRLYGRASPDVAGDPVDRTFQELENYHEGLKGRIQSAFYRATTEVLNGFSLDEVGGDFDRITLAQTMDSNRTDFELENRDVLPEYGVGNADNRSVFLHRRTVIDGSSDAVEVDAAYTLVRLLYEDKDVSPTAFYAVKDWVDAAWGTTNWVDWPIGYGLPPNASFIGPSLANVTTNADISLSLQADVWDDFELQTVRLWRRLDGDWELVSLLTGPPFEWGGPANTNDPGNLLDNLMPGAYQYKIVALDNEGLKTVSLFNMDVLLSLSGAYNSWAAASSISNEAALMNANPDGGLLNNSLEFALGGNPMDGSDDAGLNPTLSMTNVSGSVFADYAFRSLKNRETDGVEYIVEYKDDLTSEFWRPLTNAWQVSDISGEPALETATVRMGTTNDAQRFLRLKINIESNIE